MVDRERNRLYVKRCRLRRSSVQIFRDSNRYKSSLVNYVTRLVGLSKYEDKRKGRGFNIDRGYVLRLFEECGGRCCFSGLSLRFDGSLYSVSIDRIDNGVGHVVGNVQLTCMGINLARNDVSCDDVRFFVDCVRDCDLFVPDRVVSRDFVSGLRRNMSYYDKGCDVSSDFILKLFADQGGRCALSGIRMCGYRHPCLSLSVDRVDSGRSHVVGNVRLVVRAVNRARKNRPDVEFLRFLEDIRGG